MRKGQQAAEVGVGRDKNPSLSRGDGDDLLVVGSPPAPARQRGQRRTRPLGVGP